MFYRILFVLMLAAAANSQEWFRKLQLPSKVDLPKEGQKGPGASVLLGYKPIYGLIDGDDTKDPSYEATPASVVVKEPITEVVTPVPDNIIYQLPPRIDAILRIKNKMKEIQPKPSSNVIVGYKPIYGQIDGGDDTKNVLYEATPASVVVKEPIIEVVTPAPDNIIYQLPPRIDAIPRIENKVKKVQPKPSSNVIVGYKPIYGQIDSGDDTKDALYEATPATVVVKEPVIEVVTPQPDNRIYQLPPRVDPIPGTENKAKEVQIKPSSNVILGYKPIYGQTDGGDDTNNAPYEATTYLSENWDFKCPKRYGFYRYERSCDIYVECRNYHPVRKVCPDGMHFKDSPRWSEYPCAYPPEAQCLIRGGALPARPTADCPHQFGNYPITDTHYSKNDRCNSYISCSAGVAHIMNCTFGLVFNPKINLCDWPEQVPGCQDVFEFRCPVPHLGEEDMVVNYRYPSDPECRYFYSCLAGRYRLLACDEGLVFDHRVGRCVEDDQYVCGTAPTIAYAY